MNHIPNNKTEQLITKLSSIDLSIARHAIDMDDEQVRFSIDNRRQTLACLKREAIADGSRDNSLAYALDPQIELFIDTWCDQVKSLERWEITFQNFKFCQRLLDHTLPKSWHFDEDVVVIHQPQSKELLEALHMRNQKHIVIYNSGSPAPDEVTEFAKQKNIPISNSIEDFERTISLIQTPAQQVISISCDSNDTNASEAREAIAAAVNAGKRTRIENTSTVSKFGKSWAVNILTNLPKLVGKNNLHQLAISGVDDAVIVASGPSLGKNVHQLKAIQEKVFIVSALRSLPTLNAAGIEPDLVIQLDAEDDLVAQQLALNPKHQIKNLLLEGNVNPGFFAMPAKNIIWSLPQHFFDIHQEFGTKPTPFNVPSVSIYALCLCQFLEFKNICFIGQDLAASSGKQYADGATDLIPAHAKMSMFQLEVPGFYGGKVMTRNSYEYQIKRCSEIAREWRSRNININLVNATEGGAFIPEFDHMTLESFIVQREIHFKKTRKSIEFLFKPPISKDRAASYLGRITDKMDRILTLADMLIKLDNKTEKNRGIDKKIKKIMQRFKELNNSTSLLEIAMQDGIAQVIGTSRTVETVDSYAQFFTKVRANATALKAATQQNFFQKI